MIISDGEDREDRWRLGLFGRRSKKAGLDWTGQDRTGLGWVGLDWTGLEEKQNPDMVRGLFVFSPFLFLFLCELDCYDTTRSRLGSGEGRGQAGHSWIDMESIYCIDGERAIHGGFLTESGSHVYNIKYFSLHLGGKERKACSCTSRQTK